MRRRAGGHSQLPSSGDEVEFGTDGNAASRNLADLEWRELGPVRECHRGLGREVAADDRHPRRTGAQVVGDQTIGGQRLDGGEGQPLDRKLTDRRLPRRELDRPRAGTDGHGDRSPGDLEGELPGDGRTVRLLADLQEPGEQAGTGALAGQDDSGNGHGQQRQGDAGDD